MSALDRILALDAPELWLFMTCAALVVIYAIAVLVSWVDRRNPLTHARRNARGRASQARDWRRPGYLPESWK